eukprot:GFUD01128412.1.p2 GENE.GFUD01128412.1~~GFUD01128412.1.p2  ORF type:complete len:116 (-),score=27.44 GFUD01128412.1:61-378(-)
MVTTSSHRFGLSVSSCSFLLESSFVFLDHTIEMEEEGCEEGADEHNNQEIFGDHNAGEDSHDDLDEDAEHLTNHPTAQECNRVSVQSNEQDAGEQSIQKTCSCQT